MIDRARSILYKRTIVQQRFLLHGSEVFIHLKSLGNYIVVKRNMISTIAAAVQARPEKFSHQTHNSAPNTFLLHPKHSYEVIITKKKIRTNQLNQLD